MEKIPTNDLETTLKNALFETLGSRPPYPGYPAVRLDHTNRVVADQLASGVITLLPDGPWDAGTAKLKSFPTARMSKEWQNQGYGVDSLGRPLHPWIRDMLQNPEVGVVTGTGAYWSMGPNKTADPIIIAEEHGQSYVFLVQRNDNGLWALPGGFIDPGENAATAAAREAFEEGGILLDMPQAQIYSGVVADMRTTAYAWAETTALAFRLHSRQQPRIDKNEVSAGHWFPTNDLPSELHGSHLALVREVLRNGNV